ncbi:YadA-like family protein [Burkholderia cenocepacia]|uniref:YadA-like family protein n=1 Tax=Burkholderia cenocepacia TaxID=95486 RepID=UPI00196A8602|nr:ESPR-type extended signal peptide-containing protein [Burkholderia cenocepacia]MBN3503072.1 YadA-like family protein [Burkholderia cenocepacia]MCO1394423.1 YadA-like family protein [Burkholderia cenocepacia]MCO1404761.1 YadA-like family protein [Burkholderia cenocepacia]UQN96293.1 YadA-like family protein [Burkholderia cenocepacia]UQO02740.1 YadA-like family protein [Burkholderia cenocepacia]
MNKTYRNIWNAATNTWTAVAETAKSHSKGASSPRSMAGRACLTAVAAIAGLLLAQPAAATATQYGDNAAANGAAWGFSTNMGARRTDNLGFTSDMYGSNPFATAYGDYASASAQGAVAMGSHATSSGIGGMAVGTYATTVGRMGMALGTGAYSTGLQALGIGSFSAANGLRTTAIGTLATSNGADATAIGTSSNASGQRSIAIGAARTDLTNGAGTETGQNTTDNTAATGADSIAFGTGTRASADRAMALGSGASVATGDGVALGSNSVANRAAGQGGSGLAAISVGSAGATRQIINVAAGTQDTDAVNFGQMNTALSTKVDDTYFKVNSTGAAAAAGTTDAIAIGAGATVFNGGVPNPSGSIAIGSGASAAGSNSIMIGTNARHAGSSATVMGGDASAMGGGGAAAFGYGSSAAGNASVALGIGATAGNRSSVALGSGSVANADNTVSVGSDTLQRRITNLADGMADTDAVNVRQMRAGLSTTNAAIAATNAELSTTNATLTATNATLSTTNTQVAALDADMKAAKNDIATHTSDISKINDQLAGLSDGTVGLVQQAAPGGDITVGADTDGAAVNFSGKTGTRKLTGITAGDVSAASTDAVNGSQLHGVADSVASAIGGGSIVNADGSISAPAFTVGDGSGGTKIVNSVGDAVTNLDGRTTTNEGDIKKLADEIGSGTVGLVQQAAPGGDITVGADTDGAAVNFSSKTGTRKLTGITAGDVSAASSEAVNGSQLHGVADSVASAIGGGSAVNPDGSISAPVFTVGDGSGGTKIVNSVGDAVTNLDGRVTNNEGSIKDLAEQIGSGTVGLVQQAAPGGDITVGADTDGDAVNFSSKTGTRKLTGITAGNVTAASTDAVNGSQLHGVADSVASAIGGGSTVNPDGSISAPVFTVGDGSGGTKIVNSVGDVVTNLDGRTTTNEGDIKKLADEIGSGTVGLVQQANPGDDITVGANTNGNAVNFSGKTGTRKLTGVTAGDITAASTDAVNGSQLHGVADSVASAIGGGSTVNADGSISAPRFTVGDGSGGTKIVNSVGDAVTNLDGRVTNNEGGIKKLADQLGSGTVGLVRQDATSGMITVGAGGAGSVVNFAGSGGPRVLSGVANGVGDDDVVTVSQLRATGLIDYTGKEVGAVTYDSGLSFDSVTFAGTDGTVLKRVAAGFVGRDSMEAVNGGQLYALQEQFAKQYDNLSGRFDDLSSRVGELETNPNPGDPGTGGPGAGGPGTGEGSTVVGEGSNASGKNSSAIGNGAVASGENSSAIGQGSVASGNNSSAVGQGAVASGDNSSAIGQGAVASGNNSVAIGQGSVASEANTVSFGDGTEAGNRRLVNIADGINASDAATKGQLDRAMESVDQRFNDTNRAINDVAKNAYAGIAAAMAMPNMTPSQPGKTVVAVGAANFKSGSAIAAGATYRSRNGNWLVNGATSVTSVGDVGIRAQVGYEF